MEKNDVTVSACYRAQLEILYRPVLLVPAGPVGGFSGFHNLSSKSYHEPTR